LPDWLLELADLILALAYFGENASCVERSKGSTLDEYNVWVERAKNTYELQIITQAKSIRC
jgi:hypothetical protein